MDERCWIAVTSSVYISIPHRRDAAGIIWRDGPIRTLLTGAGGYIGLHILRELLDAKHQVTAVVRSKHKLGPMVKHPRLEIVEIDLEDTKRVAGHLREHDVFVHSALIWGDAGMEYELRDTAIAAKLFEVARNAEVERCIYLSSVAVHRPFSGEMRETDGLSAADAYGATKAAGELFLSAACANHPMTGVVIRPGPVVGPPAFIGGSFRGDHRITQMVHAALQGHPIEVAHGEGRQFSDVSIVAKTVRLLCAIDNPYPSYICVDRNIITWEEVADLVVECVGSQSRTYLLQSEAQDPIPRFRTERLESLIGESSDSKQALYEHIRHLALVSQIPAQA